MTTLARLALCSAALGLFGPASAALHAQDERLTEMAMPASMNDLLNWYLDSGRLGDWTTSGVTEAMWVGIPAGLKYTETGSVRISSDGTRILTTYMMMTEDGRVISTGSGSTSWDAEAGAPVTANSGFDMGKPYHGTSKLVGMTPDTLFWEYTEASRGETTTYRNSEQMVDPGTVRTSVRKAEDGAKPWVTERTRMNHLEAHGLDALVGQWIMEMPDGSTMRTSTTFAAGRTVLVSRTGKLRADGTRVDESLSLMHWDPVRREVVSSYYGANGSVFDAVVVSAERSGDTVTIVSLYSGVSSTGSSMSGVLTRAVTGDSMTTTFSETAMNGAKHDFMWSDVPFESKKVEQRRRRSADR